MRKTLSSLTQNNVIIKTLYSKTNSCTKLLTATLYWFDKLPMDEYELFYHKFIKANVRFAEQE